MKMNKAMLLATIAMTVFMNTAPITAFAQANDADKAVVEETATETVETATEATTDAEEELPYSYVREKRFLSLEQRVTGIRLPYPQKPVMYIVIT